MDKRTPQWEIQPPTAAGLLRALGVEEAGFAAQYRAVRNFVRLPAARAMPGSLRSDLRQRNLLPRRGNGRVMECATLEDARANIDRVDEQLVDLLAERDAYVRQAARFKRSPEEAAAPRRVEQMIAGVRGFARDSGVDPDLVERVYRTMIDGFTELERAESLHRAGGGHAATDTATTQTNPDDEQNQDGQIDSADGSRG